MICDNLEASGRYYFSEAGLSSDVKYGWEFKQEKTENSHQALDGRDNCWP